jgi:hypothetical protein
MNFLMLITDHNNHDTFKFYVLSNTIKPVNVMRYLKVLLFLGTNTI